MFDDDDFFSNKRGKFNIGRASSFATDMNTDYLDSHPGLTKSTSTTTRTM